ncbi:MAG: NUDIX hydrolase [Anaerolineae bacterium]|nr:NUDIX hydrolase [Anaerolineae bacterium]
MQEDVKTTTLVFQGRVFDLSVQEVVLPNGMAARREIITHPGAVAIAALDTDGCLLMVRQYRSAAGRVLLEVPAGTLEPDEAGSPEVCAERELQEEVGYKPGSLEKLGGIFVAPGYTTEYIHLFLATDLTPSRLDTDDDEMIELVRVPFEEAVRRCETDEICDAKSIVAITRAWAVFQNARRG